MNITSKDQGSERKQHRNMYAICSMLLGLAVGLAATAPAHAEYESAYYTQAIHGPYELYSVGDFSLEEGGTIHGLQLAYHTRGELNAAKNNAILICTWYSGTTKIWDSSYVGKGRALDPDKYFIIMINQIGSGLSSSPHNTQGTGGMAAFPHVTIGDDVRAQHKMLVDKFGLTQLALVTGGSMGAQQTWEWAVRYPEMVKRAAPIAGTAKIRPQDAAFSRTLDEARRSDPNFNGGYYKTNLDVQTGLRREAALWTVFGYSPEWLKQEKWRALGFSSIEDFQTNFMDAFFTPQDPDDLAIQAYAWQHGDVSRNTNGDLRAALGRIKAKLVAMPISTDHLFPVADVAEEVKLTPGAKLFVVNDIAGHLGLFGVDGKAYFDQVDKGLSELLATPVK
jgi:homoserine O-acetyltransferase/O-succinyltransferase